MYTEYYCFDCSRQCPTIEISEIEYSEAFGASQYQDVTILACDFCGSYNVEEITDDMSEMRGIQDEN